MKRRRRKKTLQIRSWDCITLHFVLHCNKVKWNTTINKQTGLFFYWYLAV